MARAGPILVAALQVSVMGALWRRFGVDTTTKAVYKWSMTFIQHTYDVDKDSEPTLNIGSYVRRIGLDQGTGLLIGISNGDVLDEKTNRVYRQRIYHVHWLDLKDSDTGQTVYSFEPEDAITSSSRSVPKFASEAEAEAWMDKQLQAGNWTDKAQDATDSGSDIDVALRKMLEGTDE